MNGSLGEWILTAFLLLCVVPLLAFAVLAFVTYRGGRRRLQAWLGRDVSKLHEEYHELLGPRYGLNQNQALERIIRGQAVRAGTIGAITSVGGFVTLPIALPVDIVLSFRIQASLISFIGQLQAGGSAGSNNVTVRDYLIMTGSSRVTQSTTRFLISVALRILGKSFSKLIPVVGAFIGFGVNFAIVQLMGRAVIRWYSSKQCESGELTPCSAIRLEDRSPSLDLP